jgi:hypothetical protein
MTYAEYLLSQGATPEDVAILDKPVARKAFEAAEIARREAAEIKSKAEKDKAELNNWFNQTAVPEYKEMERRAIAAEAEAAKARQAWESAQERGLVDLAQLEALGYTKKDGKPAVSDDKPPFDTSKFLTVDSARPLLDGAGEGLAVLQDIVMEHTLLFPDKPLRVRDLRREAVAAGKTVEQYWTDKYQVASAREARETKQREAYEAKLREEGRQAAVSELAGKYANPDVRPMVSSSSPFTARPATGRDKQPWERQDDASADRVARATQKYLERQHSGPTN